MENIIKTITEKKANFSSIVWARPCKVLKTCDKVITKQTVAKNLQIGASYDNKAVVKEARATGSLPKENQGLVGLEWVKYPYILTNPKTHKQFLRIETVKNSSFTTKYFADGHEVEKADIIHLLQASEKKAKTDIPVVMNINLEYITSIK